MKKTQDSNTCFLNTIWTFNTAILKNGLQDVIRPNLY